MAADNTDFLRFSAYSIKDLITRKLSENSKFTDQVYEGSNLAILIDLVSYMYQCLLYVLNGAAAESMFSDAQIYENISRLVEMIGYNPRGCTPASMAIYINNLSKCKESSYQILPFTYIDTGLTDSLGKRICFSTEKCGQQTSLYDNQAITLYNGIWKLYSTVFTSSGTDYEKFTLDGIKSDSDSEKYVAQKFFKIYVQSNNSDGESNSLDAWQMDTNNLFVGFGLNKNQTDDSNPSFAKLYSSSSKVFHIFLNKDKTYEIRFGNGFTGQRLNAGDKVYVFYLDTNGSDGNVDFSNIDVSTLKFYHDNSMFGISKELYDQIFPTASSGIQTADGYSISLTQSLNSEFIKEEDVDDIRENAPNWFKTGNRLITRDDYEYFIKNEYSNVIDIKCMNNWEMLSKFYKWLFDLGESPNEYLTKSGYRTTSLRGGNTYLSKYMLESRNYKYIDAADSNNVYLWTELTDNLQIKAFDSELIQDLQYIKMLTSEIYAMTPIHVYFRLCAAPQEVELNRIYANTSNNTYLEVTLDDNCIYVASTVQIMIVNIINDYFSASNCKIGQLIDNNELLNQIYQINGVKSVRTIYDPDDGEHTYRIYQGICFSSYSNDLIDKGEDLEIGNISRKLYDFQFPHLQMTKSDLLSSIKVIKKQLSSLSPIKF